MEYLEILVTKKPKDEPNPETTAESIEWGDDGVRWSETDQLAPFIARWVTNRRLVCEQIELAFRDTCHVFGDGELVHLVITDRQSKRSIIEQITSLIDEHKDDQYPWMVRAVEQKGA